MSLEQEVVGLLADGREDEALVIVARAVDELRRPQERADRLQGLAEQGLEGR